MKKGFISLCLFVVFLIPSINIDGQLYRLLIGDNLKEDAKEIIDHMLQGMDALVNNAIDREDFITESRLKEAGLMLDGLKNFVHNERIQTLEQMDQQRLGLLKGIDQIMAGNIPSAYDLNDLAAILTANTQDIANSLGGLINTHDLFAIYRINGISLEHKNSGTYKISLIGNVFGKSNVENRVLVNGEEMALHQGTNINNMYVDFPSSELERYFKDTQVTRIPLRIISIKITKRIFSTHIDTLVSFNNTILLHPKFPIQYKLVEIAKTVQWSEPILGDLKEDYTVPGQEVTVTASVSDGKQIDQEKTRYYDPANEITRARQEQCPFRRFPLPILSRQIDQRCNEWLNEQLNNIGGWVSNPVFFDEGKSVRRGYKASARNKIWIEIYYRKQIDGSPTEIERNFTTAKKGFLTYGVHESDFFSHDFASYRLSLKYFCDDWTIINPTSATTIRGIKTDLENGAIKRLTVNIGSLTGF